MGEEGKMTTDDVKVACRRLFHGKTFKCLIQNGMNIRSKFPEMMEKYKAIWQAKPASMRLKCTSTKHRVGALKVRDEFDPTRCDDIEHMCTIYRNILMFYNPLNSLCYYMTMSN